MSFHFLLVLELISTLEAVLGEACPLMHLEAALGEEHFFTVEAGELKLLAALLLMGLGQVIMVISNVHPPSHPQTAAPPPGIPAAPPGIPAPHWPSPALLRYSL